MVVFNLNQLPDVSPHLGGRSQRENQGHARGQRLRILIHRMENFIQDGFPTSYLQCFKVKAVNLAGLNPASVEGLTRKFPLPWYYRWRDMPSSSILQSFKSRIVVFILKFALIEGKNEIVSKREKKKKTWQKFVGSAASRFKASWAFYV